MSGPPVPPTAPLEQPVELAELRTLFLFEHLDEEKLSWLARAGRAVTYPAGASIIVEGEPAENFLVLLEGTVVLTYRVRGGDEAEIARTDHRGAYVGIDAFLTEREIPAYIHSMRAVSGCRLYRLPVRDFGAAVKQWFPMAMHLVSGIVNGIRATQLRIGERERLAALGAVTAGLTHELNNPAAAAGRAAATLRERAATTARTLGELAGGLPTAAAELLRLLPPDGTPAAAERSPLDVADDEDTLADWLDERAVPHAQELASAFVAAGLDQSWAERVERVAGPYTPAALVWLGHQVESRLLLAEVTEATRRVSDLVTAAKQYSQLDRAPQQRVDLHQLLDSTLAVLGHKLGAGIRVVRDYDPALPPVEVYAAELNQVWTNLIDNALDAMAGSGTLTVRTVWADGTATVEVADTGPGVPEEIRGKVFEPFFTTKPVGQGTGLGLDISWRIVTERHGGDLRLRSRPGETVFEVRLPVGA